MLSAHQPFETYPALIRQAASEVYGRPIPAPWLRWATAGAVAAALPAHAQETAPPTPASVEQDPCPRVEPIDPRRRSPTVPVLEYRPDPCDPTRLRTPALDAAQGFMLQLIEPEPNVLDVQERLQRIGLGVPDVLAAVKALRALGVEFVETEAAHTEQRGAITKTYLGSVVFELVHSEPGQE